MVKPCLHEWKKLRLVEEYHDYSGFRVGVFECECIKCGKIRIRKYW